MAAGLAAAKLGPRIDNYLRLTIERPSADGAARMDGRDSACRSLRQRGDQHSRRGVSAYRATAFEVAVGFRTVEKLARSYAEMPPGELFAIVGSSGYLEISANQDSAAKILGCETGAPVELRLL